MGRDHAGRIGTRTRGLALVAALAVLLAAGVADALSSDPASGGLEPAPSSVPDEPSAVASVLAAPTPPSEVALAPAGARMIPDSAPVAPADRPLRVALYGDSLSFEAQAFFTDELASRGVDVRARTYGGTAICDWLDTMREDALAWQPDAVVVEFVGNRLTPCMNPGGAPEPDAAYYARYEADASAVVAMFVPLGARVYFAGAPMPRLAPEDQAGWGRLNAMYRGLADRSAGVVYVDAGASVLDGGSWTETLPCLPGEPCGPDGRNVVRAPDGGHFCPGAPDAVAGVTSGCPVWSSGAWRYARAMAAPVVADFGLES